MMNYNNDTTKQVKAIVSNPLDGNTKVDIGPFWEMVDATLASKIVLIRD